MKDHGGMSWCIAHCLESVEGFTEPYSMNLYNIVITIVQVIYAKIYEFTLSLSLLYLFVIYPPPNIARYIKNYSYAQLRGIIISTT